MHCWTHYFHEAGTARRASCSTITNRGGSFVSWPFSPLPLPCFWSWAGWLKPMPASLDCCGHQRCPRTVGTDAVGSPMFPMTRVATHATWGTTLASVSTTNCAHNTRGAMACSGPPAFMMIRRRRSRGTAWHSTGRQPVMSNLEEGSKARLETCRPGRDPTLAHTHIVDFALRQQPRVMQRGCSFANRAVESAMRLLQRA